MKREREIVMRLSVGSFNGIDSEAREISRRGLCNSYEKIPIQNFVLRRAAEGLRCLDGGLVRRSREVEGGGTFNLLH